MTPPCLILHHFREQLNVSTRVQQKVQILFNIATRLIATELKLVLPTSYQRMCIVKSLWLFPLVLGIFIFITCDGSNQVHQQNGPFRSTSYWIQFPYKLWFPEWYRRALGFFHESSDAANMENLFRRITETKLQWTAPALESSMFPVGESLTVPSFLRFSHKLGTGKQESSVCTCDPISTCYTTCTSLETRCGRTCAHVTAFTAEYYRKRQHTHTISTEVNISQIGCDAVTAACVTSTAVAAVAAAAVAAFAVIIGVGIGTAVQIIGQNQINQIKLGVDQFLNSGGLLNDQIPVNDLPIPVRGANFTNDSCDVGSAHFGDGFCYNLLTRGPCGDPYYWVTLDPVLFKARCTPRLCGRSRVFIGRDGLCHDIYDPLECRGGRRLYYSAYGDPICDCPLGQYPFPSEKDRCVPLYTQGPCPTGNVVSFARDGKLECAPTLCPSNLDPSTPLVIVRGDGLCNELGTTGPCRPTTQLLGYDVFQLETTCVDFKNSSSPYFSSPEEDALLDSVFNQISAEYDDYHIIMLEQNQLRPNGKAERRQEQNTLGVFQVPSSLPDVLLNPCRPGAQRSLNFKCTNPILPEQRRRELLPAVRSPFRCPSNSFLQAAAQCVNESSSLSCGPSFRYSIPSGKCRSIFQPISISV